MNIGADTLPCERDIRLPYTDAEFLQIPLIPINFMVLREDVIYAIRHPNKKNGTKYYDLSDEKDPRFEEIIKGLKIYFEHHTVVSE